MFSLTRIFIFFSFSLFKDSFEILPWETPISSSRILMVMMFIIKGEKKHKIFVYRVSYSLVLPKAENKGEFIFLIYFNNIVLNATLIGTYSSGLNTQIYCYLRRKTSFLRNKNQINE